MKRTFWFALALIATTHPGAAQRSNRESPTAVTRAAFVDFDRENFDDLVMMVDSTALDRFKERRLGDVSAALREASDSAAHHPPDAPPCVTAFFDSVFTRRAGRHGRRPSTVDLLGVQDIAELVALSPTDFFVRWMRAGVRVEHHQDSLFWAGSRSRDSEFAVPTMRTKRDVLGEVIVSDTLAYVLYQESMLPPVFDSSRFKHAVPRDTVGERVDTALVYIQGEEGVKMAELHRRPRARWRLTLQNEPFEQLDRVLEQ